MLSGLRIAVLSILTLAVAWASAAIWIDGPSSRPLAGVLAAVLALGSAALARRVRPGWRAALVVAIAIAAVATWWLRIPPRNDPDWLPELARTARATIVDDHVTIENVRDFRGAARPTSTNAGRPGAGTWPSSPARTSSCRNGTPPGSCTRS